jgi:XTP/dITP diphosphohydrolase
MKIKPSEPILIASSNLHKVKEFQEIFLQFDIRVTGLPKTPVLVSPVENGTTFSENADIKSVYYSQHFKDQWILADDSGLCVDSLKGEPGVFSSRFSGRGANADQNNSKLLSLMAQYASASQRVAKFVCCLSLSRNGKVVKKTTGMVRGFILHSPSGEKGFGYDPLFYYSPVKKTFSEMNDQEKNKISHRFRAVRKLASYILSDCFSSI